MDGIFAEGRTRGDTVSSEIEPAGLFHRAPRKLRHGIRAAKARICQVGLQGEVAKRCRSGAVHGPSATKAEGVGTEMWKSLPPDSAANMLHRRYIEYTHSAVTILSAKK